MRSMDTAPRDGKSFVIITAIAAHRAEWDAPFSNFWSVTAQRALAAEEGIGWMSTQEWKAFALSETEKAE